MKLKCFHVVSMFQVNSSIAVRFTDMHIEAHGECMWDFVEIREGKFVTLKEKEF